MLHVLTQLYDLGAIIIFSDEETKSQIVVTYSQGNSASTWSHRDLNPGGLMFSEAEGNVKAFLVTKMGAK